MADMGTPSAIRESDYDAILTALTDTDRGRWFLQEYTKRNQKPDTQVVLEAIGRLEKAMTRERAVPNIDRIRLDIADMQEAIERTKREIANIKHEQEDGNRFIEASNELDAIVTKTESATQEILAAAEAIQETAWTLRENGADEASCDDIDARATEIFMACSFQDLTGQRTQKIVQVLQYLESRINLMISIWGIEDATATDTKFVEDTRPDAHLLNGPQMDGKGVSQNAVDEMFGSLEKDTNAAGEDPFEAAASAMEAEVEEIRAEDETGADDNADDASVFAGETASQDEIEALFASPPPAVEADEDPADVFQTAPEDDAGDPDYTAGLEFDDIDFAEADVFERPEAKTTADDILPEDDIVMIDDEDTAAWEAEFKVEPEDTPKPVKSAAPLSDDDGDDPMDQLSPGEKQSLFS
ncbi:protein phosphatase CheZ [Stappia sp. MMSF_3263]|uniref:protein phosphatase CheZ n=1 Tax=Stappia sp. MMSF_3263 TaxID=3046693 RepID=UPI00274006AA|nr:protein phosphatase CheZ [Stappia sp. MMSF_3263]